MIGSDEALKGDTFGGLVVAAVKANSDGKQLLEEMGVRDSKKLTPLKIKLLAEKIKDVAEVYFVSLMPSDYNKKVAEVGLTGLLNELHTECIKKLRRYGDEAVVDMFPGCDVKDAKMETKAEDTYIEVAAASVIARNEALKQIKEISLFAGFNVPLGSTHVVDALLKLRESGKDFDKFTKTSFKNVKAIMNPGE